MRAVIYEGVGRVVIKDVKKPEVKPDSVIVKVESCAICGTDYKAYTIGISSIRPPVILGHEFVGRIEEVGKLVEGFKPGDRVTMATTIPCGRCEMCMKSLFNLCFNKLPVGTYINGALAEYLEVPWRGIEHGNLMKVPEGVSDNAGALSEPLGCVINSQIIACVGSPDTVVVIGGGPLGILQAETAKARGALKTILIQRSRVRFELAKRFKIDHLICSELTDPEKAVLELTHGKGSDVVINAAPSPQAVELAFRLVARSGRVSLFASLPKDNPSVSIDANLIHYGQISVFGASDSTPQNHAEALELILNGKISADGLITHVLGIDDFFRGIELIKSREALKVIIKPHH
ncbi:MAG: alcohol dehydrogenase catalytic domain-containing protein [Spirochaetota bacterium]